MFNLITAATFSGSKKAVARNSNKPARKIKSKKHSKPQASKTQAHEAIELQWLKQFLNARAVVILLFISAVLYIPWLLPAEEILPVEKITVSGDYEQINMTQINRHLDKYLGKGFFTVDIKTMQQNISQQPWIKTVSVKRVWPDQLHVDVTRKQAVARWDDEHLLSQQAIIFKADIAKFQQLPRINGYEGQTVELLQRYSQIQKEFADKGIEITEMLEDNKGALTLVLNNKLKVNIGSENNDLKIKHLLAVYPHYIKPRVEQIKQIDFRYSNGFSIAWKEDVLDQSGDIKQRGSKHV